MLEKEGGNERSWRQEKGELRRDSISGREEGRRNNRHVPACIRRRSDLRKRGGGGRRKGIRPTEEGGREGGKDVGSRVGPRNRIRSSATRKREILVWRSLRKGDA